MSESSKIMVVGDVHRWFPPLNTLINKKKPEIVLACGDFGYWPRIQGYVDSRGRTRPVPPPKVGNTKVYWCDGNHEDFASLKQAPLDGQLWPNIFWKRRGSTLTLPDGRVVLFMGGAESTDKDSRTEGWDWFPEESITQADIDAIPPVKIDIVISHTCPMEFDMKSFYNHPGRQSRMALSIVLEQVRPKEWYFGHWHYRSVGEYNGTHWTALNMLMEPGCWLWL